jgi:Pyruvate/2-oxoacid:ferredoxin oxidoreductase gamma subunit
MLGAVVEMVDRPSVDPVREAIRETVPDGTEDLNEQAFDRGRTAVQDGELDHPAEQRQEVSP